MPTVPRLNSEKMSNAGETLDVTLDTMFAFKGKAARYWKKRTNTCLMWTSFVFLAIANVIDMIIFIVPGWGWTHETTSRTDLAGGEYYGFYGVWWGCWRLASYEGFTTCWPYHFVYKYPMPPWFKGFQAVSVVLVFCGFVSFILISMYMCLAKFSGKLKFLLTYVAVCCFTGCVGVTQFTVFVVQGLHNTWRCCHPDRQREIHSRHLWFCFVLSCVMTGFYFASAIAALFEAASIYKDRRMLAKYQRQMEEEKQERELMSQASGLYAYQFTHGPNPFVYHPMMMAQHQYAPANMSQASIAPQQYMPDDYQMQQQQQQMQQQQQQMQQQQQQQQYAAARGRRMSSDIS